MNLTDEQLTALRAAYFCLCNSKEVERNARYIDNIHDENSKMILFRRAQEVLTELLFDPKEESEEHLDTDKLETAKAINRVLETRLKHLLQSEFIRSYDDRYLTGEYKKDIKELDEKVKALDEVRYQEATIIENAAVEILKNTRTGETLIRWCPK